MASSGSPFPDKAPRAYQHRKILAGHRRLCESNLTHQICTGRVNNYISRRPISSYPFMDGVSAEETSTVQKTGKKRGKSVVKGGLGTAARIVELLGYMGTTNNTSMRFRRDDCQQRSSGGLGRAMSLATVVCPTSMLSFRRGSAVRSKTSHTIEKTVQMQRGNCHETFARQNSTCYRYSRSEPAFFPLGRGYPHPSDAMLRMAGLGAIKIRD